MPSSGRHMWDNRLLLLVRVSWHLGFYCTTRRQHTNRGTKLAPTKAPLPVALSETGGTTQRVLHARQYETGCILTTRGQRLLHDCRRLP